MHGDFHLARGSGGRNLGSMLFICRQGYEGFLERELGAAGLTVVERERGWIRADPAGGDVVRAGLDDLCFPHLVLLAPTELLGDSVNALARQIVAFFAERIRGEKIDAAWPCIFRCVAEVPGLARRMSSVETAVREALGPRLARVARLASDELPRGHGMTRGLFVMFAGFGRVFVAREAWRGGQRRMADDPGAPSRSYLKIEEAYALLGAEPESGETVCDLGAAPGGWSYSAAKRGARVIAVDNGPLKAGALDNPLVEHRPEDAFRFRPAAGGVFDWMFCDLVEDPHHVLRNLIVPWVREGWCRRFVGILKFGRADPIALLDEVRGQKSGIAVRVALLHVRHLYHDREEFTLVGALK